MCVITVMCLLRVQCEYYKARLCLGTNGGLFVGDVRCGAGMHELKSGHLLIALQKDTLCAVSHFSFRTNPLWNKGYLF